jgi:hypothetical protein
MNIAEEFAEHLVDLTRHDARPDEINLAIIRFLACRTDRGAGSYPLGSLLAQLEDELLRIAARLRGDPGSGYDTRLVSNHAPDRIARQVADLRWTIREEANKLKLTSCMDSIRDAHTNTASYNHIVQSWTKRPSGVPHGTTPSGSAQFSTIGALAAFLAVLFGEVFLIAWTAVHLALK